jgi:Outer membrane protein beta-barrel domain
MKNLYALIFILIASVSHAADFAIEAGFRQQSGTSGSSVLTAKSQNGFQFGVSSTIPLKEAIGLRTGLMYVQRPLILQDATNGEAKINLSYFDVPVAVSFKFEEYASVFFGTALSLKLEDSVSSSGGITLTKLTDAKSTVLPIQFGASFKFAPQLGATVFYETLTSDVAKDLGSFRAIGVNLMLTYD